MSLLDEAKKKAGQRGPSCSISRLPSTLQAELADALEEHDGEDVTYVSLAAALAERDDVTVRVGAGAISRHHRGVCLCGAR